jgi:hypothetical protein
MCAQEELSCSDPPPLLKLFSFFHYFSFAFWRWSFRERDVNKEQRSWVATHNQPAIRNIVVQVLNEMGP